MCGFRLARKNFSGSTLLVYPPAIVGVLQRPPKRQPLAMRRATHVPRRVNQGRIAKRRSQMPNLGVTNSPNCERVGQVKLITEPSETAGLCSVSGDPSR